MSTIQSSFDKVFKKLKELDKKISTLSAKGTATRFVALRDVIWDTANDSDDPPKEGSVPRWNTDTQKLSPGGGPPICKIFTPSGTLSPKLILVEVLATSDEMDFTKPSLVTVTVQVDGDFVPKPVTENYVGAGELSFTSPPSGIPDTEVSLSGATVTFNGTQGYLQWNTNPTLHWEENPIIDLLGESQVFGSGGNGHSRIENINYLIRQHPGLNGSEYRTPECRVILLDALVPFWNAEPVPTLEYAETSFWPDETNGVTLQWVYSKGQPMVIVLLSDLDNVYDEEYTLYVLTRVLPLP